MLPMKAMAAKKAGEWKREAHMPAASILLPMYGGESNDEKGLVKKRQTQLPSLEAADTLTTCLYLEK
jgi:hypothetical protein